MTKRPLAAFGGGAAIGVLGGLIGLGGAAFRLPLLALLLVISAVKVWRHGA